MKTRLSLLLGSVILAGVVAFVASPAGAAPTGQRRFGNDLSITAYNSGAGLDVDQLGTGSILNLSDGGVDETTLDQSSNTTINPWIINGSADAYQLRVKANSTQSTPPVAILNASGTPVFTVDKDGGLTLPSGDVSAAEIANVVRYVQVPLGSFYDCQTDAGALVGFDTTADALADFVNSATDGTGRTLRFDDTSGTEDQSMEVCSEFMVPADYASGGAFKIRALKDAHTAATEVLNVGVSVNGAALQTAGTTTTTTASSTAYTVSPTIAALAADDSVSFYVSITSDSTMNDIVDVAAVSFFYTATQ